MTTTLLTVLPDGTTYEPAAPEPVPHPEIVGPDDLRLEHAERASILWSDGVVIRRLRVSYVTQHGMVHDDLAADNIHLRGVDGGSRRATPVERTIIRALSLGHVARLAIVESGGAA